MPILNGVSNWNKCGCASDNVSASEGQAELSGKLVKWPGSKGEHGSLKTRSWEMMLTVEKSRESWTSLMGFLFVLILKAHYKAYLHLPVSYIAKNMNCSMLLSKQ